MRSKAKQCAAIVHISVNLPDMWLGFNKKFSEFCWRLALDLMRLVLFEENLDPDLNKSFPCRN